MYTLLLFVQCTYCLYFSVLVVVFQTVDWQCVLEYVNGIVNCIKVEVTDFVVDFEMLHFPSCCDLNTEGVRLAYSECEPVLRDTWTKV